MRWFLLVFLLSGCANPDRVQYVLEFGSPDVWDERPAQSVTAKIEVVHGQ